MQYFFTLTLSWGLAVILPSTEAVRWVQQHAHATVRLQNKQILKLRKTLSKNVIYSHWNANASAQYLPKVSSSPHTKHHIAVNNAILWSKQTHTHWPRASVILSEQSPMSWQTSDGSTSSRNISMIAGTYWSTKSLHDALIVSGSRLQTLSSASSISSWSWCTSVS